MRFSFRRKTKSVIVTSHAHVAFSLPEIAIHLMSYLQPEHILVCLQVCRAWKAIFELELWANVVYLPPSCSPMTTPREHISEARRRHIGLLLYGKIYYESILPDPMGPEVRFVNWWCKPSGSSKVRLASLDTGFLICQSCNSAMAQALNYWDLHLTLASHQGGREDAGGNMRRRVIVGGGGRWKIYRRMTPEQWKGQGPLIRSLAGIDIWDEPLATAVGKYCGREGGGILQHLEVDMSKPLVKPAKQLQSLRSFFSAFAVNDGSGGGSTLTSVSFQFCDWKADIMLLWSLRELPSLSTLEIRGLIKWAKYPQVNERSETADRVGMKRSDPTGVQCRVEDLLHVVVHACPNLETLRLTKLLIEDRMTANGDSNSDNKDSVSNRVNQRPLLFPEVQPENDLTLYHHPNLRRLILPMTWRKLSDGSVDDAYRVFFRAFSHLSDLDLTVVDVDFREQSANETLAEILQHSGQHLQYLTLRFYAEDLDQPSYSGRGRHVQGSVDFEVLSKFFPKSLRSLSLRDVRLHESNFTKISPEVLRGLRRLRLNYRQLSAAQVQKTDTELDRCVCCFARELFEFVMFNCSYLIWLEIAQGGPMGKDLYHNNDGNGYADTTSLEMYHPRQVLGTRDESQQQQRPWACRSTLEYLDVHRFPLFYDKVHSQYVDQVVTERLNARVMPQLKHLGISLLLLRFPYKAISMACSRGDVKGDQEPSQRTKTAAGQQPVSPSPILDFGQLQSFFVQGATQPLQNNTLDEGKTTTHSLSVVELETLKNQVLSRGARLEYCHFGELKLL